MLALTACGRVSRDAPTADVDAASSSGVDAASDSGPNAAPDSGANHECEWNGFAPPVAYAAGAGPVAIAIGDLNHDARADLVVANWGSPIALPNATVSVFLNQARGAFAAQAVYPTDIELGCVGAGDFNGDGYADVAVANALGDLDVLINAGDGTLEPFVHYDAGISDDSMAVADFDGDGQLDLAIATDYATIGVFLGKGDGTFAPIVNYTTGSMPYSMSASDVNGDGHVDLVLTNVDFPLGRGLPVGLGAGTVNVLMNRGDGTFASQVTYAAGQGTTGLAVADLNGDGHPDLAVVNSVDQSLQVYLNAGDGTFGAPTTYANGALGVAAADFNGDGQIDLAIIGASPTDGGSDDQELQLLFNLGDGSFASSSSYAVKESGALTVAELNGDGLPDVALIGSYEHTLNVFLSKCK